MELTSAPVISQMPEARNYKTGWLLKMRGKGKNRESNRQNCWINSLGTFAFPSAREQLLLCFTVNVLKNRKIS